MSKNNYWVLQLQGEEPKLFESWHECEVEWRGASRAICHGFPDKDEAMEFKDGTWSGEPISEEARTWLEKYKTKAGELRQDTGLDTSALSLDALPEYCAYVDGSYDPESEIYGLGVVFICDGKIETLYGGGKEKGLVKKKYGAGALLACMEAIKRAEALGLSEFTVIYDREDIQWAYRRCGSEMLSQVANQYMHDIGEKMKLKVMCVEGLEQTSERDSGMDLAGKLAQKGAGIAD